VRPNNSCLYVHACARWAKTLVGATSQLRIKSGEVEEVANRSLTSVLVGARMRARCIRYVICARDTNSDAVLSTHRTTCIPDTTRAVGVGTQEWAARTALARTQAAGDMVMRPLAGRRPNPSCRTRARGVVGELIGSTSRALAGRAATSHLQPSREPGRTQRERADRKAAE